MTPYYTQVIGIGLLWVTIHCVGMCGPIIASLTAGMGLDRQASAGARTWRATRGVLAYQTGRALVYAALGAAAGLAGAAAQTAIEDVAKIAGLAVAVMILAVGFWKLLPARSGSGEGPGVAARFTSTVLRRLNRLLPSSGPMRMMSFGVVLGFLPCVLMFWVLGIAASTASVFHGAAIMLLLVAMTTPVLILAACGTSLPGIFAKLRSDRVIAGAMLVSGSWLALIAAAANGWIEHVHIPLQLFGDDFVIMLW